MRCPNCASIISDQTTHCPQCGYAVASKPAEVTAAGQSKAAKILIWVLVFIGIGVVTTLLRYIGLGGGLPIALVALVGISAGYALTTRLNVKVRPVEKIRQKYESMPEAQCRADIAGKLQSRGVTDPGATELAVIITKLFKGTLFNQLPYADQRRIRSSAAAGSFLRENGIDIPAEHTAK